MNLDGIILAAGYSSRAGCFKAAYSIGGKSLLEHAVDSMRSCCRNILVVGGHRIEALARLVQQKNVCLIRNQDYERGMFSSVQQGIRALPRDNEGAYLLPVDCPLVPAPVFTILGRALATQRCPAVVPGWQEQRGHPVLLGKVLYPVILEAEPHSTLRLILKQAPTYTVPVHSHHILDDLDTAAELEDAALRHAGRTPTRSYP